MATEVVKTVRASGGNYTTLSAWEAGEQRNLVSADEIAVAEIYDDWGSGLDNSTSVQTWTTDATRYIHIRAAAGHEQQGDWAGGGAYLNRTGSTSEVILWRAGYGIIEGLRIRGNGTNGVITSYLADSGANLIVRKCLLRAYHASAGKLLRAYSASLEIRAWNVIAEKESGTSGGDCFVQDSGTLTPKNCTAIRGHYGFRYTTDAQNCVSYGASTQAFYITSGTESNNASDDGTAPGTSPITGIGSDEFADYASGDFHLASDSQLIGAGADLSGTFTDDIDGDTRSSWDIGADEYVSAGLNVIPSGIASAEAFGTPTIAPGVVSLQPSGIASAEAHGTPTVVAGALTISPAGIASAEFVSAPTVAPGAVAILPSGIASLESVPNPALIPGAVVLTPNGIASAEAFGAHSLNPGPVTLQPGGIASAEAFGNALVSSGAILIAPTGIPSLEAFGSPAVAGGAVVIVPNGIPSAEAFGVLTLQPGAVSIQPASIGSGEAFGAHTIVPPAVIIAPEGITSGELFGDGILIPGATVIQGAGIVSEEAFGAVTIIGGEQLLGWLAAQLRLRPALAGRIGIKPGGLH